MKVNYFQAETSINNKAFPCYIITGNEAFQQNKLTQSLNAHYRHKGFEIVREQITQQNCDLLYRCHNTLSLFATKRLLQITFTKTPDKNVQRALIEISGKFHADDRYLFIFNEITSAQQKSKWFRALIKHGLHIHLYPATIEDTIKILKLTLSRQPNIRITDDAVMLIANKTEGNLPAADHVLSLLQTQPETEFDSSNIVTFLADFMRYDVFDLAQSITCQNQTRALAILDGLLQQHTEPAIILWAIVKELRLWILLSSQQEDEQQKTFSANYIWRSKQFAYTALSQRFAQRDFKKLMRSCLVIDFIIKGALSGNVRQSLTALVCDLIPQTSGN